MLRSRLFRHILLDHDQPVAALVQRVGLHARFGSCTRTIAASKAAITSARCWGRGKAVTTTTALMSNAFLLLVMPQEGTPGLRRSCRQSRWLTSAASICATLPPASTVSMEGLLLLPGLLAAARIRGSGHRVKAGKAIALRCPQGGLGAAARPGHGRRARRLCAPLGRQPSEPPRSTCSCGWPALISHTGILGSAYTYANCADGHLGPCAGRRRGERHGPLSAAHAEPGNLRTLAAVTDTPAQRAESAFWSISHVACRAPRSLIGGIA
jgi:hypothetical protein